MSKKNIFGVKSENESSPNNLELFDPNILIQQQTQNLILLNNANAVINSSFSNHNKPSKKNNYQE